MIKINFCLPLRIKSRVSFGMRERFTLCITHSLAYRDTVHDTDVDYNRHIDTQTHISKLPLSSSLNNTLNNEIDFALYRACLSATFVSPLMSL